MGKEIRFAFLSLIHPIRCFEEVKYEGQGNLTVAFGIQLLFFLTTVIARQATGFPFNPNDVDDINVLLVFLGSWGLFLLWLVSNIALTNMMEGEGTPLEVIVCSSYALLPYIVVTLASVFLSNFLTIEAYVFTQFALYFSYAWCAVSFLIAVMTAHQFSFRKALVNIVLSLFFMAAVAFVLMLTISLLQQVYVFFYTLYNEIVFRL